LAGGRQTGSTGHRPVPSGDFRRSGPVGAI
jgi:hypothetical protein